jgi:hypothetical protein
LFKLLIDLHFDNAQKQVPQKTNAWSPAFSVDHSGSYWTSTGSCWVKKAGGVRHHTTSHSYTNPLHELFGQTTYLVRYGYNTGLRSDLHLYFFKTDCLKN